MQGRTIWIADAHGYGKRFVVRAREKLTAFTELESAIPVFQWAIYRRLPARAQKGVFETLGRYG
jgi:hypothetical protein